MAGITGATGKVVSHWVEIKEIPTPEQESLILLLQGGVGISQHTKVYLGARVKAAGLVEDRRQCQNLNLNDKIVSTSIIT